MIKRQQFVDQILVDRFHPPPLVDQRVVQVGIGVEGGADDFRCPEGAASR